MESPASVLEKVPLFRDLTSKERDAVCSIMILRTFREGETIVYEEDTTSQTFFVILEGTVNVTACTSEGKETILATLNKGDFFGEMAILDGEPRSASVVADQTCTLSMLYRDNFLTMLQKYPKTGIQMLITLSRRLRRANRHINTLSLMRVYGRVAEIILELAQQRGRRYGTITIIPDRPTHQKLADMAGTSRETVSRILSQLQQKGFISLDRKRLVILDEKKLYA